MDGRLTRITKNRLSLRLLRFCASVFLFAPIACNTVDIIDPNTGATSTGFLYTPDEEGSYPGVIVLHGGGGLKENHHNFANALSRKGYVAIVVDYFADGELKNIDAGYEFLRTHPAVDKKRIAMVGFSRGANFSMGFSRNDWISPGEKEIAGIVLYYIGNTWGYSQDANLPPILFLHGVADEYVRVGYIEAYCRQQEQLEKPCKFHFYKDVGHGFDASYGYNRAAKTDAFRRAVEFLDQYVKG